MNKVLGIITAVLVVIVLVLMLSKPKLGSAPSGLPSTHATSSTITVPNYVNNPLASVIGFATSTYCASRVITTSAQAILFTLGETSTTTYPTGTFGHLQAASTTVSYDAGVYGCGAFRMIGSGSAASIITVTELR